MSLSDSPERSRHMKVQYAYICDWDSDRYEMYNLCLLKDLLENSPLAEQAYDSLNSDREPTVFSKFGGLRLGTTT